MASFPLHRPGTVSFFKCMGWLNLEVAFYPPACSVIIMAGFNMNKNKCRKRNLIKLQQCLNSSRVGKVPLELRFPIFHLWLEEWSGKVWSELRSLFYSSYLIGGLSILFCLFIIQMVDVRAWYVLYVWMSTMPGALLSTIFFFFFPKEKIVIYNFVRKDSALISLVLALLYLFPSERDGKYVFPLAFLLV